MTAEKACDTESHGRQRAGEQYRSRQGKDGSRRQQDSWSTQFAQCQHNAQESHGVDRAAQGCPQHLAEGHIRHPHGRRENRIVGLSVTQLVEDVEEPIADRAVHAT